MHTHRLAYLSKYVFDTSECSDDQSDRRPDPDQGIAPEQLAEGDVVRAGVPDPLVRRTIERIPSSASRAFVLVFSLTAMFFLSGWVSLIWVSLIVLGWIFEVVEGPC